MSSQILSLAQRCSHVQQQLSQVTADFSLDPDGHEDSFEVLAVHPGSYRLERVLDVYAESGFDQGAFELSRHRIGALTNHRVDRLCERKTRGQAPRDQLQRLCQLSVERL